MNKAAYGRIRGHNFFFGFLDIFVWDEMAQNRASWTASSLLMFEFLKIFDQHLFFNFLSACQHKQPMSSQIFMQCGWRHFYYTEMAPANKKKIIRQKRFGECTVVVATFLIQFQSLELRLCIDICFKRCAFCLNALEQC